MLDFTIELSFKFHARFLGNLRVESEGVIKNLMQGQVAEAALFDVRGIRKFARYQIMAGQSYSN